LTIDKNIVTANILTQNAGISKQVKEHGKAKKMKISGSALDLKVEVEL